jgi:hypothetical protein
MRTLWMATAALLLLSATAFAQNIRQGEFSADVNSDGWTLAKGTGARTSTIFVAFDDPFDSTPNVVLCLTGYEMKPGTDGAVRVSLKTDKVTKAGFMIKVHTWGDSQVTAVSGTWMAYPKK